MAGPPSLRQELARLVTDAGRAPKDVADDIERILARTHDRFDAHLVRKTLARFLMQHDLRLDRALALVQLDVIAFEWPAYRDLERALAANGLARDAERWRRVLDVLDSSREPRDVERAKAERARLVTELRTLRRGAPAMA